MLSIAGKELRSLFVSPLAWTVLAVVQVVLAYMFLIQLESYVEWQPRLLSVPDAPGGLTVWVVAPLFNAAGFMMMIVVPLLTMRLVSEELRSGTLTLLLSAPRSMTEVVLGKFLGLLAFLCVVMALVVIMCLLLLLGGNLDFGLLASCLLGLFLLTASIASAGLYMSTLTQQPVAAATSTFGLLLVLWIIDFAGAGNESRSSALFAYLSISNHVNAFFRGIFDSRDIVYYLLFITTFLTLCVRRLDGIRLQR
ncbi:MAG TPA: ABC transporter permease [Gammaproteobacteria bacterium]|nr:ABC transporter permease [Gammaproteobacteria bacterium]